MTYQLSRKFQFYYYYSNTCNDASSSGLFINNNHYPSSILGTLQKTIVILS